MCPGAWGGLNTTYIDFHLPSIDVQVSLVSLAPWIVQGKRTSLFVITLLLLASSRDIYTAKCKCKGKGLAPQSLSPGKGKGKGKVSVSAVVNVLLGSQANPRCHLSRDNVLFN